MFLGLGSNLGDRLASLRYAVRCLDADPGVSVDRLSSVYETEPVGYVDQPRFLNMVVEALCSRAPEELLDLATRIEAERGRERPFRNAPRHLDIDVLLYADRRIEGSRLTVPHPRMTERGFVLVPLLELAPALAEPGTGVAYREYLRDGMTGGRRVLSADAFLSEIET